MLLTSSQVSVLISSGIVVLCTAALFLSGYAIQQRTLRDLRAAINPNRAPRPSPKIYLPDQFKKSRARLGDGTPVDIDDPRYRRKYGAREEDEDVVVVRPTIPEDGEEQQEPVVLPESDSADDAPVGTPNYEEEKEEPPKKEEPRKDEKPISRAERRRQIKEDIRRLSEGQEPVYYQRRLW